MAKPASFVSVVAVAQNDAPHLETFANDVLQVLSSHYSSYELVLVDDGSTDATPEAIDRILQRHECVRAIRLSRRFGVDIAVTAGLDSSIGDFALVMLAACDPPEKIPDMVARGLRGADVVIGTTQTDGYRTWVVRQLRRMYFKAFRRLTAFALPENAASMRMFSRQALNALTRIRQKTAHARLLGCSVGFRAEVLPYVPVERAGARRPRPLAQAAAEGVSLLVANSPAPLRLVSWMGGAASLLNLAYMLYIVSVHFWKDQVAEGWTTLSLQMAVMFLFLFATQVVISEYLVHTFEEVKDRPLYHVADEKCSSTALADAEKRNVCDRSTDGNSGALSYRRAA